MVERAEAAGCRAICVTVDTPVAGARNREERAAFRLPAGMELPHLKGLATAGTRHSPSEGEMFSTVPATIDALPGVVHRVAGRMPVLVDGGSRRGTDVLKAIALGRSIAEIGKSVLWGAE